MYNVTRQNKLSFKQAAHIDFLTSKIIDVKSPNTRRIALILLKVPRRIESTPKPQLKNKINMESLLQKDLTEAIIKSYYEVYNELGYGFLEKVYQNAMIIELKNKGFNVESEKRIQVYYKDMIVGDYFADIIVNNAVIIELKATEILANQNDLQLLNYLRATDIEVGLLLNFGKTTDFREPDSKSCIESQHTFE